MLWKNTVPFALCFVLPSVSFAAVADSFRCDLKFINNKGIIESSMRGDFDAVRKVAVGAQQDSTVSSFALYLNPRWSSSRNESSTSGISASLEVRYTIAARAGVIAYQNSCTTYSFCDRRVTSGKICFASSCAGTSNPGDPTAPNSDWKQIPLENGIPIVDASSFAVRQNLDNGEVLEGSCQHRGTTR